MSDKKNTSVELMAFFGIDSREEFRRFWNSLEVEEQVYYRTVDLSS